MIDAKNFNKTVNGKKIDLFTLKNQRGTTAQITNFGGRIVSLYTADKNGKFDDIVLGYDNIDAYFSSNESYFGAIIGRFGNRIGNGGFTIDQTKYTLDSLDDNKNQLHGGQKGFHNAIWEVEKATDTELTLSYISVDDEEGFPGNVKVTIKHVLTDHDELQIFATATTDKATHINLTYHSFFNLGGVIDGLEDINDNVLQINADHITPVDEKVLPNGDYLKVKNTAFDFTSPKTIGQDIEQKEEQLIIGAGYDHNFVINGSGLRTAAIITDPKSGRTLELISDEPGLQFYSTNYLNGSDFGKNKVSYKHRHAFCLEPQHFPNTPNIPSFPTTQVNPGEVYSSICIYKFSAE